MRSDPSETKDIPCVAEKILATEQQKHFWGVLIPAIYSAVGFAFFVFPTGRYRIGLIQPLYYGWVLLVYFTWIFGKLLSMGLWRKTTLPLLLLISLIFPTVGLVLAWRFASLYLVPLK